MPEIKHYDYRLFSIDVCQNCFSYRFNHDPNLVFHSIDPNYFDKHESPVLTPKGNPEAPFYYHYLKKRWLHLGPLFMTGPEQQDNERIWFGFNINKIKKNYSNIQYTNFDLWEDLVWHSSSHPSEEEKSMRENLFLSDYLIKPPTQISLPESLDCSLAECIITRTPENISKAERFAKKRLESVIFDLDSAKKIWNDYLSQLTFSDEEWYKYIHEPGYHFPECGCEIEDWRSK